MPLNFTIQCSEILNCSIFLLGWTVQRLMNESFSTLAAVGRARDLAKREGHRSRMSTQSHPQFLVFSSASSLPSSRLKEERASHLLILSAPFLHPLRMLLGRVLHFRPLLSFAI